MGAPADLIRFDPDEPIVVDPAKLHSRAAKHALRRSPDGGQGKLTMVAGKGVRGGVRGPLPRARLQLECIVKFTDKFEMCPKCIATVVPDRDGATVHGAMGPAGCCEEDNLMVMTS